MYSKYLYSKINETKSEVVFLIPTKEEIRFLEANNIKFRKSKNRLFSYRIKMLILPLVLKS